MSAVELAVVILAAGVPLSVLATGLAFWAMGRQNQKHLEACFDRFLSRNMSEYGMTDMIKKEIEADQEQETEEDLEDQALNTYIAKNAEALRGSVS